MKCVSDLLGIFKGKGIKVEYLHCDNSGEHISKLIILCQKEGIKLEYTAPGSPVQNGNVDKNQYSLVKSYENDDSC